jgi:SAM-dependent methyltransferase
MEIDTTLYRFPRHRWPKIAPPLSEEQISIMHDWMYYWHRVMPQKYSAVHRFNDNYPLKYRPPRRIRTLEFGSGLGSSLDAHAELEELATQDYHCVEIRENMAAEIKRRFPSVTVLTADCQSRLPYEDGFFDRLIAVHVLEHLPDLPRAIVEAKRLLKPGGIFSVVIPCDPGVAYDFARKISSERIFKRRYKIPYMWLMRREHLNSPSEILTLLGNTFDEIDREYFPLKFIPMVNANLCIGVTFRRRAN